MNTSNSQLPVHPGGAISPAPPDEPQKNDRHHQWDRARLSEDQLQLLSGQRERWLAETFPIQPERTPEKTSPDHSVEALIRSAESYFSHTYLSALHDRYRPIDDPGPDAVFDNSRIGVFEITRWVADPEENAIDKLVNFYQVFSKESCNLALLFHRTRSGCQVYLAVCNTAENHQETTVSNVLLPRAQSGLRGNFPGIVMGHGCIGRNSDPAPNSSGSAWDAVYALLSPTKDKSVAVISALSGETSERFRSQTIEKLLDGMVPANSGEEYTLMLLAAPVCDYEQFARTISDTYTALSPHAEIVKSATRSESVSVSSSATKGLSAGASIGAGFGVIHGGVHAEGHWDSTMGEIRGLDEANGATLTYTDYRVKYTLTLLDRMMQRLEQCRSTGMWNYAAYVISQDKPMASNVAHMYAALTQGEGSYLEASSVTVWPSGSRKPSSARTPAQTILNALCKIQHPAFSLKHAGGDSGSLPIVVDATNLFSTLELARAMNLPRRSVAGFPVTECAAFGRSVSLLDEHPASPGMKIGRIWHMRHDDGGSVRLDPELLPSHVFITGSTGSGKSNTVYQLLDRLHEQGKSFLVVEPAKGEYKSVFGGRSDVTVYGTDRRRTKLLRLDPFSFPEGVPLFAHLDRLLGIFNACWPMYAAMPAVLKDAVERAYVEAGWDLRTSENRQYGRLFPTFADVLRQIDLVMNESDYSGDSKGDYKGALKTRLKSLTNGVYSDIFSCDAIPDAALFDRNVIVDLSELGPETTSLIMGMLVLKLQEHRMAAPAMDAALRHVTVLEEAHNLLRRTSAAQTPEGGDLVGRSVEMLTNAIAEMRTYGECFMIVDQAPGALDPAAIRNTNTKLILRLPDQSDRELVGRSIGLNDYQITELGKLERGVAAVYQSGWIESVLCKLKRFDRAVPLTAAPEPCPPDDSAGILLNAVLYGASVPELASVLRSLKERIVYRSALPLPVKRQVWQLCDAPEPPGEDALAALAYELLGADALYAHGGTPEKAGVARLLQQTLRRYQISEQALQEAHLTVLTGLLERERRRREASAIYAARLGGVR